MLYVLHFTMEHNIDNCIVDKVQHNYFFDNKNMHFTNKEQHILYTLLLQESNPPHGPPSQMSSKPWTQWYMQLSPYEQTFPEEKNQLTMNILLYLLIKKDHKEARTMTELQYKIIYHQTRVPWSNINQQSDFGCITCICPNVDSFC